jgi:palmitoyltransferase
MIITGPGFATDVRPRFRDITHTSKRVPVVSPPSLPDPPTVFSPPHVSQVRPDLPPPPPRQYASSPSVTEDIAPRLIHDSLVSDSTGPNPSQLAPIANVVGASLAQIVSNQQSSSATLAAYPVSKLAVKGAKERKSLRNWRDIERPVPRLETGPRWCRFCEINKPDRTHHCRHCGTCVLQFDRGFR